MAQEFYVILTNAGLAYEARCKANQVPIVLTELGVGDGNGAVYNPGPEATALRNERHRQPFNSLLQDENNPSWLCAEALLPPDVGGWVIREVGIYTDTGILYAIGKYPESVKPILDQGSSKQFYVTAIFQTSNASNVTLLVDNNQVMATRAFVLDHVKAELAKRDVKESVLYTTTGSITLSGLTVQPGGDWSAELTSGDRVLVKDQSDGRENGIYLARSGSWVRAQDADANAEVTPGMLVVVETGSAHADSIWQLVTDAPISVEGTTLDFEMVHGRTGVSSGTYDLVTINDRGQVVAGRRSGITALSTNTQLTVEHAGLILLDATAGPVTVTLPSADGGLGIVDVIVRRVDNSANVLRVQASGADKLKFHVHLRSAGYGFLYLMGAGDWWHLRSDGAGGWWPIGRYDSTALGRPVVETTTAFSPGGWGALNGPMMQRADWPWLWDHAQQSGMLTTEAARAGMEGGWTSGDGAVTFRGPEGRGEFFRVLDDGLGVDDDRVAGSGQAAAVGRHNHGFTYKFTTGGSASSPVSGAGALASSAMLGRNTVDPASHATLTEAVTQTGIDDARPRNIAYPGRIKLI